MLFTHIIIGTGDGVDVPNSVINESLRDTIHEGDQVILPWYGRPTPALAAVYDYVFDQNIEFHLIHETGGKIPSAFTDSDLGVVINPNGGMAKYYADRLDGSALVIGTDAGTDEMIMAVHALVPDTVFADLGDGLTVLKLSEEDEEETPTEPAPTIEAVDEDPTAEEPAEEEPTDPDVRTFSTEELESMPLKVLKRLAAQVVEEVPSGNSKAPIIEAIEATKRVSPAEVDSLDELLREAQELMYKLKDSEPSRPISIAISKLEEAMLWYHYGADIGGK